ncbi:MAG: CRISPR-associated endonuclease Cas2 [Anaerolineaceae bacterium]|jgi:CRISPR-associated protein Cas2|nr:MAG: CRISPR-associated endonuclease Cas2 [Anaerolineaceae bacterium]
MKRDPNLLLFYDISDDRKRTKIADVCLDFGLDRIQFSAFSGWLLPARQEELFLKLKKLLGKKEGNIQMFSICAEDWKKRRIIEQRGTRNDKGSRKDSSN